MKRMRSALPILLVAAGAAAFALLRSKEELPSAAAPPPRAEPDRTQGPALVPAGPPAARAAPPEAPAAVPAPPPDPGPVPARATLRGTLRYGPDASVVAGARVAATSIAFGDWQPTTHGTAVSDAAGRFTLDVPTGVLLTLVCAAEVRGVPGEARLHGVVAPAEVDLQVQPLQGSVRLTAVDEAGAPLADVEVRRLRQAAPDLEARVLGRTDRGGTVLLTGLPRGWAVLAASAPGYLAAQQAVVVGSANEERVVLERGKRVTFTVCDPAGRPVEGARLQVRHAIKAGDRATTDARGSATFHVSTATGFLLVACDASGFGPVRLQLPLDLDTHRIELNPARVLTVFAADGAGVLDVTAEMIIAPYETSGGLQRFTVRPGEPYVLGDLQAESLLLLQAVDGAGRARYREIPVGKGPTSVTFQALDQDEGKGAPLRIEAAAANGGAARVAICLYPRHLRYSLLFRRYLSVTEAPLLVWRPLAWPYVVETLVDDRQVGRKLDIEPGRTALVVRPPRLDRVHGHVLGTEGGPSPGAYVVLLAADGKELASRTAGPDGEFEFAWASMDAGGLRLRAGRVSGESSEEAPVVPGATDVTLRLQAPAIR